jgi:ABC-type uncharacterized transport system ATPase subunit
MLARIVATHPSRENRHGAGAPIVEIAGVTKRFPGVIACDRVDLAIRLGEVHVLLGENGAGKSTLVGMLSGLQQPDEGTIHVDGEPRTITSPRRALDLGIGTVFQHVMLVPSLTVAENVALGGAWWRRPDRAALSGEIRATGAGLGIAIDPEAVTGSLSLGEQQQAEIIRALMRGGRVLILDEATAMLTPKGAEDLGALMRRLAARGLAVVFITHKLKEAFAYGDRISILRLGRKVGEIGPERLHGLDEAAVTTEIVRLMFGTAVPVAATDPGLSVLAVRDPAARSLPAVLEVRDLAVADPVCTVIGISLSVGAGEVLGIAGIDGNGQKQLAETLAGQRPAKSGSILLEGRPIDRLDVGARRRLGLRYVTDDRLSEGTVGSLPVSTNFLLKQIGEPPFWCWSVDRPAAIAAHARRLVAEYDVRTPGMETPIARLSGGNIQKALLARELSGPAKIVIFAKPTSGLDLQTSVAIRRRIREGADAGIATLLISTDLDELLELCDRIAVMSRGRLVGTVARDADTRRRVGEMMTGLAA